MKFRERSSLSPIEWLLELIKDYETLIISRRTEYASNPKTKKFVSKIDRTIKNIAKML